MSEPSVSLFSFRTDTPQQRELDALRRENRELREELAEWRRRERGDDDARWFELQRRFKITPTQARILSGLIDRAGRVATKDTLMSVCGSEGEPQNIDVHMVKIRAALQKAGWVGAIETVYNLGYFLRPECAHALFGAAA